MGVYLASADPLIHPTFGEGVVPKMVCLPVRFSLVTLGHDAPTSGKCQSG